MVIPKLALGQSYVNKVFDMETVLWTHPNGGLHIMDLILRLKWEMVVQL